ncbi:MAG: copper homeostasis protein CutC [Draconibacterium sp.]
MIKEACVESFEEAVLAEKFGAERIELCADLHLDGLTPSFELMQKTCSTLKIPVMVMIRPRGGDFIYSDKEILLMKNDIDLAKKTGAAGVVFGLLTNDNQIDIRNTRLLAAYAQPLPVTFHKAIDLLGNPIEGAKILTEIQGIKRILTSGGKATAFDGQETIRKMIEVTGEKITILVAGKVLNSNIEEIQKLTGATEFHGKRIVGELTSSCS